MAGTTIQTSKCSPSTTGAPMALRPLGPASAVTAGPARESVVAAVAVSAGSQRSSWIELRGARQSRRRIRLHRAPGGLPGVQHHGDLLRALPGWTLRVLFPRQAAGATSSFEAAARDELLAWLRPDTLAELKWYFEQRRRTSDPRVLSFSDEDFWRDQAAFSAPRFQQLYRRWLTDGDSVFDVVSSPAIAEALERGTGRIESHVLLLSHRHLSPLASLVRLPAKGVEEGGHVPRTASTPSASVAFERRPVDPRRHARREIGRTRLAVRRGSPSARRRTLSGQSPASALLDVFRQRLHRFFRNRPSFAASK